MRFYVPIWIENNTPTTNVILPIPVGVTIAAAVRGGCTHGTVTHTRTLRGSDATIGEVYCWSLN